MKLETEIFGHYFEIPCVDGVGSCDYDDLCSSLPKPGEPCPPAFVKVNELWPVSSKIVILIIRAESDVAS